MEFVMRSFVAIAPLFLAGFIVSLAPGAPLVSNSTPTSTPVTAVDEESKEALQKLQQLVLHAFQQLVLNSWTSRYFGKFAFVTVISVPPGTNTRGKR
jgi:hypothetical protein